MINRIDELFNNLRPTKKYCKNLLSYNDLFDFCVFNDLRPTKEKNIPTPLQPASCPKMIDRIDVHFKVPFLSDDSCSLAPLLCCAV